MLYQRDNDAALFWNEVFLNAALADSRKPMKQQEQPGPTKTSRVGAIVHAALHNAVNGVDPTNQFYCDPQTNLPATPTQANHGEVAELAAAAAAHHVLIKLYPSQQQPFLDPELARFQALPLVAGLSQAVITVSIAYGTTIAQQLLDARTGANDDGAGNLGNAVPSIQNSYPWQPDTALAPPGPGLDPHWGNVRPFLTANPQTFLANNPNVVDAPPGVPTPAYANLYNEVYNKGNVNPPNSPLGRNPDEENIALFWSYDDALGTPIRLYNLHTFEILNQETIPPPRGISLLHRHARLFALVNLAMADAGIICWWTKYNYNYWRPFQGIRLVDGAGVQLQYVGGQPLLDAAGQPILDANGQPVLDDTNPNTAHDQNWRPLGRPQKQVNGAQVPANPNTTPNFPAYLSGHSTFGAAAFGMLRKFFGPRVRGGPPSIESFTLTSEEVPNARTYSNNVDRRTGRISETSWQRVIRENSESRIFLGVHWRNDATRGVPAGQKVADNIWNNFLRPR